ncbi:peroxisomal membrane protein PEX13 [Elysia marginata]|uniref:Peroxisomal membrane protein PEX13 n=1 Tax=Elysia marginata TaxID=1093978 RepID=A0AAV4EWM9_9GAST|nr:peroxisomal membrane protein PEX13 [Elysia marginata]
MDGKLTGMIPANYVKILGKRRGTKKTSSSQPAPQSQAISHSASTPALSQAQWGNSNSYHPSIPSASENQFETAFSVPFQESSTIPASSNINNSVNDKDASDILSDSQK